MKNKEQVHLLHSYTTQPLPVGRYVKWHTNLNTLNGLEMLCLYLLTRNIYILLHNET